MKTNLIFSFRLAVLLVYSISVGFIQAQELGDLRAVLDSQKGQQIINIPAGKYLLDNATHGAYRFTGLNDVQIVGNGAEIFCNSQEQAFRFTECTNVIISNFSIDYDPLCFTQGEIVAREANGTSFEVEIDAGYPLDNINAHRVNFYEKATRELKKNSITTYSGNYASMEKIGDRRFRFVKNGNWNANEAVGDLVALDVKAKKKFVAPHTIQLEKCTNMKLQGVTIYGSNSFSFYERECYATHYDSCRVARGHMPDGIAPRLRSGNADGIHSSLARKGPLVEHCEVGYNGDDGIIVCGRSFPIVRIDTTASSIYLLSREANPAFYKGDTLRHVLHSGIQSGRMHIQAIEKFEVTDADRDFLKEKYPGILSLAGYTTGIRISLAAWPQGLTTGDVIYNENYVGKGFEIRHNKVGYTRSRGILIKAHEGIVHDNEINHCAMNGILVAPEIQWMGGGFAEDVVISNNTVSNCMFERTNAGMLPGAISVFYANGEYNVPTQAGAFSNIRVSGNIVQKSPYPAIVFTSVQGLSEENNQVDENPGIVREHGKRYNVTNEAPYWRQGNTP